MHQAPFELGMGLVDMPFEIANVQCENPEAAAHTRIGWFRSVSNIPRAFAVQSMVAEIAHATNRDPKDMLLELIGSPRIVKLDSVKDLWNYGEPYDSYPIDTGAPAQGGRAGRGQRAAGDAPCPRARARHCRAPQLRQLYRDHRRGGRRRQRASSRVPRVDTAIDCGTYVNPERIQSQIEGAAIMGTESRQIWRDHLQGRQGAAAEFRRFPGDPDRRIPCW